MADVCITEFTDPGCPWAFSAEPFRARLSWLYGAELEWKVRLVGLAASPQDNEAKGLTAAKQARAFAKIAREHGMPIDTSERPRTAATVPACRAVVAARIHAPDAMRALLRSLRVRTFAGELLDEPETIAGAARDAGIEPDELQALDGRRRRRARARGRHGARPRAAARRARARPQARQLVGRAPLHVPVLRDRAAAPTACASPCRASSPSPPTTSCWPTSCPGWTAARSPPSAAEVLEWAGTPLASKEVAVLCDTDVFSAREELGRVARERPVGADGYWSLS